MKEGTFKISSSYGDEQKHFSNCEAVIFFSQKVLDLSKCSSWRINSVKCVPQWREGRSNHCVFSRAKNRKLQKNVEYVLLEVRTYHGSQIVVVRFYCMTTEYLAICIDRKLNNPSSLTGQHTALFVLQMLAYVKMLHYF